jgi:hypothetical protein
VKGDNMEEEHMKHAGEERTEGCRRDRVRIKGMAAGQETLHEESLEVTRDWAMELYKGKETDVVVEEQDNEILEWDLEEEAEIASKCMAIVVLFS